MQYTLLHLIFVVSAMFPAFTDWFTGMKKDRKTIG